MDYAIKGHPRSMPGDFYVEQGCCVACGVPEAIAPDLIAHDKNSYWHCYWKKQPETANELDRAVEILHTQELGCHHYGGSDAAIIERLPPECCDFISPPRPTKTWNFAGGPGIEFMLLDKGNLGKRIWGRILGHRRGAKQ